MRGATAVIRLIKEPRRDFNPRAPCGARLSFASVLLFSEYFNPRAPCGARRRNSISGWIRDKNFNPRAPCGARRNDRESNGEGYGISTHAPLAGRDQSAQKKGNQANRFQPTRPLRGATGLSVMFCAGSADFNPRAPCGARQQKCTNHYAHFCDNRQISDAFTQNAACQGILLLFDAGKPCGFWVRTAQVISAHLCFAL